MRVALMLLVVALSACRAKHGSEATCGGQNQACCEGDACSAGLVCEIGRCLAEVACPATPPSCPATGVESFAPDRPASLDIAVDCNAVYWTESGAGAAIMRQPLCGGSAQTLAHTGSSVGNLWLSSTSVYWTEGADDGSGVASDEIMTAPLTGGAVATVAFGQHGVFGIRRLTGDATHLYWRVTEPGGASKILGMLRAGGTPVTLATLPVGPGAVATDGDRVFWTTGVTGGLAAVSVEGGSVVTLASGGQSTYGVTVDAQGIYWTDQMNLLSLPLAGTAATTLATIPDTTMRGRSITTAGDWVYWIATDNASVGEVLAVRRTGGAVVTLQSGVYPWAITSDAEHVYWTLQGVGQRGVMRAPLVK